MDPSSENGPVESAGGKSDMNFGGPPQEDKTPEFDFDPPPECPVFAPTEDEFRDPLRYIAHIREQAERYGICKILPPKTWRPPFAVNVDKLTFTPRVQRLNELDARTRVKLNFLDQIAKFWELQGSTLKMPLVERRCVDLYVLHKIVKSYGGFRKVTLDRKWSKIGTRMGYTPGKGTVGSVLKHHYERILYPFDLFKQGETMDIDKIKSNMEEGEEDPDKSYKPHGILGRMAVQPPIEKHARRSKRFASEVKEEPGSEKKMSQVEMKRLRFYGAGPKIAASPKKESPVKKEAKEEIKKSIELSPSSDPLSKYICVFCTRGDDEHLMLLCDGCDDSFHTFCLNPPLSDVPKGDWRCPKCVAEEVSKPSEAFGFEQAKREYTLQQFGDMADQFKTEYFNMPINLVTTSMVENEFWRIVSAIDEDVTVEYGADLHTMDHGSGFPTRDSLNLLPLDQEYADSPWNLNNLPLLEDSVLGYINADISGMKVPWMYVGMCFSTFCWHNEDHWSYSINYLHWGEPKTWYGVPGSKAEAFEMTMREAAPELFESQPDLLHQLVTIMNPNILMKVGIPVFRTDQQAGEFVITFPRAYHAGFNQGYNFAEAVNFCPADWLEKGRDCITHYSSLKRFCVFSHDELVCGMALTAEKLTGSMAEAVYKDLCILIDKERGLRAKLLQAGVHKAEVVSFELLCDDERQCDYCKTTCFMSAVTCPCNTTIKVCTPHFDKVCDTCKPSDLTFLYRYSLDEFPLVYMGLRKIVLSFQDWLVRVQKVFDLPKSHTLAELEALYAEALDIRLPKYEAYLLKLKNAIDYDAKYIVVAEKLLEARRAKSCSKLSLNELKEFNSTMEDMTTKSDLVDKIHDMVDETERFHATCDKYLGSKLSEVSIDELRICISNAEAALVVYDNLKMLKSKYEQASWLYSAINWRSKSKPPTEVQIKTMIMSGERFPSNPEIENQLNKFRNLLKSGQEWERRVEVALGSNPGPNVWKDVQELLSDADILDFVLPSETKLTKAVNQANKWLDELKEIEKADHYPYVDEMEEFIKRGETLQIRLPEIQDLKGEICKAVKWKKQASEWFLPKSAYEDDLMQAISPKVEDDHEIFRMTFRSEPSDLFKDAENREMTALKKLHTKNAEMRLEADSGNVFCVCAKPALGWMIRCNLCSAFFHKSCVRKATIVKSSNGKIEDEERFLCKSCRRTKRPQLTLQVLPLLEELQLFSVKLREGDALQYLAERAMKWQEKAKTYLTGKVNLKEARGVKALREVLMEGDVLEVYMKETAYLADLLDSTSDKLPVEVFVDPKLKHSPKRGRHSCPLPGAAKRPKVERGGKNSHAKKSVAEKDEDENEETEGSSEDDEICAAPKCLPPPNKIKQVTWVQCDGSCNLWFHLHCIGLKVGDVGKDYYCPKCKPPNTRSSNRTPNRKTL